MTALATRAAAGMLGLPEERRAPAAESLAAIAAAGGEVGEAAGRVLGLFTLPPRETRSLRDLQADAERAALTRASACLAEGDLDGATWWAREAQREALDQIQDQIEAEEMARLEREAWHAEAGL